MFHNRFKTKTKTKNNKKNAVEYTKFTHINVLFT